MTAEDVTYVLDTVRAVRDREDISWDRGLFLLKHSLASWDSQQERWILTPRGRLFACKVLRPDVQAKIYAEAVA